MVQMQNSTLGDFPKCKALLKLKLTLEIEALMFKLGANLCILVLASSITCNLSVSFTLQQIQQKFTYID